MPSNNHLYNNNLLDECINSELMRVCKSVLPYMDPTLQKKMAVGIKLFELISVMNMTKEENLPPTLSFTRGDDWQKSLLLDIRSQLAPEKAYLVDAALKFGELRNIMALKNSLESLPNNREDTPEQPAPTSSPSSNDLLDKFSPFLDDSQKQMLKLFSTFMK